MLNLKLTRFIVALSLAIKVDADVSWALRDSAVVMYSNVSAPVAAEVAIPSVEEVEAAHGELVEHLEKKMITVINSAADQAEEGSTVAVAGAAPVGAGVANAPAPASKPAPGNAV